MIDEVDEGGGLGDEDNSRDMSEATGSGIIPANRDALVPSPMIYGSSRHGKSSQQDDNNGGGAGGLSDDDERSNEPSSNRWNPDNETGKRKGNQDSNNSDEGESPLQFEF